MIEIVNVRVIWLCGARARAGVGHSRCAGVLPPSAECAWDVGSDGTPIVAVCDRPRIPERAAAWSSYTLFFAGFVNAAGCDGNTVDAASVVSEGGATPDGVPPCAILACPGGSSHLPLSPLLVNRLKRDTRFNLFIHSLHRTHKPTRDSSSRLELLRDGKVREAALTRCCWSN